MKIILLFMSFLFTISSLESQTLIIKKRSGQVKEVDILEIESMRMNPPIIEAEIGGPQLVDFDVADCSKPVIEKLITLVNIGGKELLITHSEFKSQGSFRLSTGDPLICSLKPRESFSFAVIFEPQTPGDHRSELILTSNAVSGLKYKIELTGKYVEHNFEITQKTFNLGDICRLSAKNVEILIENKGNGDCRIMAQSDDIEIKNKELNILAGKSLVCNATIRTSEKNGKYSGQVIFSGPCNKKIITDFDWNVRGPLVECNSVVNLSAKPGDTASTTIIINNKSGGEDFWWTESDFSCNQFELGNVKLPILIKSGDSLSVKLNFIPTTINQISGFLTLRGNPCDIEVKIPVKGSPGNIQMLFMDGFENSELGEFPYSTGWQLSNYGISDSIPYVTKDEPCSGEKSLYAWGSFGPPISTSNYIRFPIKNIPQVIFAECDIMINQIGSCGMGFMKTPIGDFPVITFGVEFGNHAHFYYVLGDQEKRWQNDFYIIKKWYRVTLKYDNFLKRVAIWINGEKVADESVTNIQNFSFDELYLSSEGGYPGVGSVYFDNVKIWTFK